LGAGFSIAMRDLEIRGTGDILGTRQHGNIAAVGFHLYTRLLADAVRQIRVDRQPGAQIPQPSKALPLTQELRSPVNIELPLHLGIPSSYVPDRETRLRLYRRLADLASFPEIDALHAEFTDRFGPIPQPVQNLFYQLRVRLLAEKAGLSAVTAESGQIVLRYPPLPEDAEPRLIPDVSPEGRPGKNSIWMSLAGQAEWQEKLMRILHRLAGAS